MLLAFREGAHISIPMETYGTCDFPGVCSSAYFTEEGCLSRWGRGPYGITIILMETNSTCDFPEGGGPDTWSPGGGAFPACKELTLYITMQYIFYIIIF